MPRNGGAWNWRQKLDKEERLDHSHARSVCVERPTIVLVPDSDAWRLLMCCRFSGASTLWVKNYLSRGAAVTLVSYVNRDGIKVGLDDCLVQRDHGWETSWPAPRTDRLK